MKRLGVIGIVIEGSRDSVPQVQAILSEFGELIKGRMGLPDKEHNIHIISIIIEGYNEQITALTGKLGRIKNVSVKSALTKIELNN